MQELEQKLNYCFHDRELLRTALTHSSYANEHRCASNERLEFVGDSVLGMVTASHLYLRYPDLPEGKSVEIRKSRSVVKLVELEGYDPYDVLARKLGWSGSNVK